MDKELELARRQKETEDRVAQLERVAHPSHYNWIPGVECLDVIEHFDFNLGNVIKYVWRAPCKDSAEAIVDLRKAAFYLEREIELLKKE